MIEYLCIRNPVFPLNANFPKAGIILNGPNSMHAFVTQFMLPSYRSRRERTTTW